MNARVLIVDDAPLIRGMLRDILGAEGFTVVGEAADGAEAVSLYRTLRPDLVILDIVMPQMDGLSTLRQVRAQDPHATVVMCSAVGQDVVITEAIEAGAREFIVKPFDPARVVAVLRSVLPPTGPQRFGKGV